jgi:tRNA-modifying protein YgfZ
MTYDWQNFLIERGARIDAGAVGDFGDAAAELRAARDGGVISPLTHLGLMACEGEDAQAFLHGQLSNDVKALAPGRSEYAAYCSAKGRMLANFLLWREEQAYLLQLSLSLQPAIQKRLGMYVMRSKVKLTDASQSKLILGLSGSAARGALQTLFAVVPEEAHQVVHDPANGTLIALPGNRFQLVAETESAKRLWRALVDTLVPVGTPCWEWLEIRNGIPLLTPATQEQFVPQMANMELIGAVNFQKGCYPGQEIVARTQYLGQTKRRMVLAHVAGPLPPKPGDALYGNALDVQAIGMVVNAQSAPDGGYDLLAVMQTANISDGPVHINSADGPALSIQPLPYTD